MIREGTKIWYAKIILSEEKRSIHYVDLCDILKKRFPNVCPSTYTPKQLNASLSKELDKEDTPFIRDGNGYYSIKRDDE